MRIHVCKPQLLHEPGPEAFNASPMEKLVEHLHNEGYAMRRLHWRVAEMRVAEPFHGIGGFRCAMELC
eukprot:7844564-Heterocapsa_arctica.AAC.1